MKYLLLVLIAVLSAPGCAKNSSSKEENTQVTLYGHLRYSCSCYDGPGLYYVIENPD